MTQLFGADVDALVELGVTLARIADHLEHVDLRTADGLARLAWTGRDADAARHGWDEVHAVTLHRAAGQLREAAVAVLTEAEDQLVASEASTGAPGVPAGPAGQVGHGGATSRTAPDGGAPVGHGPLSRLRTVLAQAVEDAHGALEPYTDGLGGFPDLVDALGLAGLRTRAVQGLDALPGAGVLEALDDFSIGAGTAGVLEGLGHLGTAMDAYSAYQGFRDGDLWQATDGTVSVGLAGLAASVPHPGTIGAGIMWSGGTAVGELANVAMAGTDFERRFTERMDVAFELGGAWGMLNTPGALMVTAGESVVGAAQEAWTDATGLWDRLAAPDTEVDDNP